MSLLDAVRSILGIKPVKVGDLAARVSPQPTKRQPLPRTNAPGAYEPDPESIEVILEYKKVLALVHDARAPLIFVTGGAGTGKSTLIEYLRRALPSRIAVVAPTGVAAINVRGMTIHSLFRLPPRIILPSDARRVYDRRLYTKLQLLIVDEVSMVRPDLLDGVDRFLRLNRESDAPFGGVQVLLIGDLFQLPPVAKREEQRILRETGYSTDYFFDAKSLSQSLLVPVLLKRVFRQSDPAFIRLLNRLREGSQVPEALKAVNARCIASDCGTAHELTLTCTNHDADQRNRAQLADLPAPTRTYAGSITGKFRIGKDKLPAPFKLTLKRGAQVMFTKNDENKRWVNGTVGRVVEMRSGTVRVETQDRGYCETFEVSPVTWEKYEYKYDSKEDRVVAEVVGRYTQIPLMLAWAVTIHKAQGKTLSKVFIDLGSGAFAPGQVYVALSRVRSLQDIRLARPIREDEATCDPRIVRFYRQMQIMTETP